MIQVYLPKYYSRDLINSLLLLFFLCGVACPKNLFINFTHIRYTDFVLFAIISFLPFLSISERNIYFQKILVSSGNKFNTLNLTFRMIPPDRYKSHIKITWDLILGDRHHRMRTLRRTQFISARSNVHFTNKDLP